MKFKLIDQVKNYHAHVYFDNEHMEVAEILRATIEKSFKVKLGELKNEPVGPHPKPMYLISFNAHLFSSLVPWLMLNRNGLSILIHPTTGDDILDHTIHCIWMGTPLTLNIDKLN
ncbi:MAG: 4,5-dioxygenase [Rhodospirillaceae bacterium]|nr:4,5-dioxygenase [Rhodospirillaceae bacterium]